MADRDLNILSIVPGVIDGRAFRNKTPADVTETRHIKLRQKVCHD